MDHLNTQEDSPSSHDPPPYSEKQPHDQQPLLANPVMPTHYASYGTMPSQGPLVQPLPHITVVPAEPSPAPDYLLYSIFNMLCCCQPLGIVALVYSIRTRDSNHMRNVTEAKRNSKMALIFNSYALGIGIIIIIVSLVCFVVFFGH